MLQFFLYTAIDKIIKHPIYLTTSSLYKEINNTISINVIIYFLNNHIN